MPRPEERVRQIEVLVLAAAGVVLLVLYVISRLRP